MESSCQDNFEKYSSLPLIQSLGSGCVTPVEKMKSGLIIFGRSLFLRKILVFSKCKDLSCFRVLDRPYE